MTALRARETHRPRPGRSTWRSSSRCSPLLGPQPIAYDQLGELQPRTGNRSANNAPRNTYRPRDGSWVAVSTSAQSIAERVMRLVGRPEYVDEPWFASGAERAQHADELDEAVGSWIAERDRDEVVAAFEEAQAAVAPIYDMADVFEDPQYRRWRRSSPSTTRSSAPSGSRTSRSGLSETPGAVRSAGPPLGAHTAEVLARYGVGRRRSSPRCARTGRSYDRRRRTSGLAFLALRPRHPARTRSSRPCAARPTPSSLDLEDAVPPDRKEEAARARRRGRCRRGVAQAAVGARQRGPPPDGRADLEALAGTPVDGPAAAQVREPAGRRDRLAIRRRTAAPAVRDRARRRARLRRWPGAHPQVRRLSLGEADLAADLRVRGDDALEWARAAGRRRRPRGRARRHRCRACGPTSRDLDGPRRRHRTRPRPRVLRPVGDPPAADPGGQRGLHAPAEEIAAARRSCRLAARGTRGRQRRLARRRRAASSTPPSSLAPTGCWTSPADPLRAATHSPFSRVSRQGRP